MANTVYDIFDSFTTSNLGGCSGELLAEFAAPSLSAAQNVAQTYSTLFQRSVVLNIHYGGIGSSNTVFYPSTSLLVSALPSGITF